MIEIISIQHAIQGRVRLKVRSQLNSAQLEYLFRQLPHVYSASYTQETHSLLLYYYGGMKPERIVKLSTDYLSHQGFIEKKQINFDEKRVWIGSSILILRKLFNHNNSLIHGAGNKYLGITSLSVIALSTDIFQSSLRSLFQQKKLTADALTSAAIIASLLKKSPNSALIILVMASLSELITASTARHTRHHIGNMLTSDLVYAWKVQEHNQNKEEKVKVADLKKGDLISVFVGEKIPVDGEVIKGTGVVDEASITGEFFPAEACPGDKVYAGSILSAGQLKLKVEEVGEKTAVQKMIHMIEEAQSSQSPIQVASVRMSEKMVPVSFLLAVIVYMTTGSWERVLSMLTIDYVCGLKLSAATAFSAAVGEAAKQGALIKGGQYIETLAQTDSIIFDKTGTLTEGRPIVERVRAFNGYSKEDVIRFSASAEEHSSHPIAEAILTEAKKLNLEWVEHDHDRIENVAGRGIKTYISDQAVHVGTYKFMEESGIDLTSLNKSPDPVSSGENVVYVAIERDMMGIITIQDKIRQGMGDTIKQLKHFGVKEVGMLTGDKEETARTVSKNLDLDYYHAEVLPNEKAEYLTKFKQSNKVVMMVGDGINDAPALAYADVGVTMGAKRTDIAIEASDVAISSDNPETLLNMMTLSRKTMNIVQQNFVIIVLVNSAAILLGALGAISPVWGAGIHNGATILTVFNSARIILGR